MSELDDTAMSLDVGITLTKWKQSSLLAAGLTVKVYTALAVPQVPVATAL